MTSIPAPFRLSMKALMLAPFPAPAVFSALYTLGWTGHAPWVFFMMCLSFGYLLSITATAALALGLLFIGHTRPVSLALSTLLGVVLGCIGYGSFLYIGWSSSGPDSGPPEGPFPAYFLRNWHDPFGWIFVVCGLVSALLFHFLTLRFLGRKAAVSPNPPGPA